MTRHFVRDNLVN